MVGDRGNSASRVNWTPIWRLQLEAWRRSNERLGREEEALAVLTAGKQRRLPIFDRFLGSSCAKAHEIATKVVGQ